MPSPFPGMDPYLENPEIFPDFHDSAITSRTRHRVNKDANFTSANRKRFSPARPIWSRSTFFAPASTSRRFRSRLPLKHAGVLTITSLYIALTNRKTNSFTRSASKNGYHP